MIYKAEATDSEAFRRFCQVHEAMGRAEQGLYDLAVGIPDDRDARAVYQVSEEVGALKTRAADLMVDLMSDEDQAKVREQFRNWSS